MDLIQTQPDLTGLLINDINKPKPNDLTLSQSALEGFGNNQTLGFTPPQQPPPALPASTGLTLSQSAQSAFQTASSQLTPFDYARQFATQTLQGATGIIGEIPTALGEVSNLLHLPGFVSRSLFDLGDSFDKLTKALFPDDPRLQGNFFWDTLPESIGSFAAFILAAAGTGGAAGALGLEAGVGEIVGGVGLGAAGGIADQHRRLAPYLANGTISPTTENLVAVAGAAAGVIQMVPLLRGVGKLLGREAEGAAIKTFDKTLTESLSVTLPHLTAGGTQMALEATAAAVVGTIAQNGLDKTFVDSKQKLLQGVGEAAGSTAISGFLIGAITGGVGLRRAGVDLKKMTATKAGREVIKSFAIKEHLLTPQEADVVGDNIHDVFKIIQNRLSDKLVTVIQKNKKGEFVVPEQVLSKPTSDERALERNPLVELSRGNLKRPLINDTEELHKATPEAQAQQAGVLAKDLIEGRGDSLPPEIRKGFDKIVVANGKNTAGVQEPISRILDLAGKTKEDLNEVSRLRGVEVTDRGKPQRGEPGEPYKIIVQESRVTQREKDALGNDPTLIEALTNLRNKKGKLLDITKPDPDHPGRLLLNVSEETQNNLINESKRTPDIFLRAKLRLQKRNFIEKLGTILDNEFVSPADKARQVSFLQDQFNERVDQILKKSDNTLKGARKQVKKFVEKIAKLPKDVDRADVRETISLAFDELKSTDPDMTHLQAIEMLPFTKIVIARGHEEIFNDLRDRVINNRRDQPYTLRTKRTFGRINDALNTLTTKLKSHEKFFAGDVVVDQKGLREEAKDIISDLPPVYQNSLLKKVDRVDSRETYIKFLHEARAVAKQYLRQARINEIRDLVKRTKSTNNPTFERFGQIIKEFTETKPVQVARNIGYDARDRVFYRTASGVTLDEKTRIEFANDPVRFAGLGKAYEKFGDRVTKLILAGGLTPDEGRLLRFLATNIPESRLGLLKSLNRRDLVDYMRGRARTDGVAVVGSPEIAIKSGTKKLPRVFFHEFTHLLYGSMLTKKQGSKLIDVWKTLTAQVDADGITEAQKLVAKIRGASLKTERGLIDYYATNPNEFLAMLAEGFMTNKIQTSNEALLLIKDQMKFAGQYLRSLARTTELADLVPEPVQQLLDSLYSRGKPEGGTSQAGLSLLFSEELRQEVRNRNKNNSFFQEEFNDFMGTGFILLKQNTQVDASALLVRAYDLAHGRFPKLKGRYTNKDLGYAIGKLLRIMSDDRPEVRTNHSGFEERSIEIRIDRFVKDPTKGIEIPAGANKQAFLEQVNLELTRRLSLIDTGNVNKANDVLLRMRDSIGKKLAEVERGKGELPAYNKPFMAEPIKKDTPVIQQSKRTGRRKVNQKELKSRLDGLTLNELENLSGRLKKTARKGRLEKQAYKQFFKFDKEQDVARVQKSIEARKVLGQRRRQLDTFFNVAKSVIDPSSTEGWLQQIVGKKGVLRQLVFNAFEKPVSDTEIHKMNSRNHVRDVAKDIYKVDINKTNQHEKFMNYLSEKLPSGATRGEAMYAFALLNDVGRRESAIQDGVESRGKMFTAEKVAGELNGQDRDFVLRTRAFIDNHPVFNRAFGVFRMLNGMDVQTSEGHFTSTRGLSQQRLSENLDDFTNNMTLSTGALKVREESAREPFKLDGGFLEAFYRLNGDVAKYAHLGLDMHRAEAIVGDPNFRRDFTNKFGKSRVNELDDYLRNILGRLGHNKDALDSVFTWIPHAWLTSKIALNVTSSIRQTFSIMTAMGDNILDSKALVKSLAEGAGTNKRIGADMKSQSGMAFMRLVVGRLSEALVVLGERNPTSKLTRLQNRAFVLQKFTDDFALRVTWRAAEIMAEKKGLKGQPKKDFILAKFEKSLTRNQASNSPLYSTPLEISAIKHPVFRGALVLQRELNRLYNVTRRHIVTAIQEPSKVNTLQAGNAIFWVGIANTVASVGINELRRKGFGLPASTRDELSTKALSSIVGRWYIGGNAANYFIQFGGKGKDYALEQLIGPASSIFVDTISGASGITKAILAGKLDPNDPGSYVNSGAREGQSKQSVALMQGLDKSISAVSGIFGLPFWAVWFQGRGAYNWTKPQYIKMSELEAEYRRSAVGSTEREQILKTKQKIRDIHKRRIKGILTDKTARSLIDNAMEVDSIIRSK